MVLHRAEPDVGAVAERVSPLVDPLTAKLERGADLTAEDRARLASVVRQTRNVERRKDLIQEGDAPSDVQLVLEGFACRYKVLPDGRRQIMAFLIPGDFCDFHVAMLGAMDHAIATLTPCTMVAIPRETIADLTEQHPQIARALLVVHTRGRGDPARVVGEHGAAAGRETGRSRPLRIACPLAIGGTGHGYELRLSREAE